MSILRDRVAPIPEWYEQLYNIQQKRKHQYVLIFLMFPYVDATLISVN